MILKIYISFILSLKLYILFLNNDKLIEISFLKTRIYNKIESEKNDNLNQNSLIDYSDNDNEDLNLSPYENLFEILDSNSDIDEFDHDNSTQIPGAIQINNKDYINKDEITKQLFEKISSNNKGLLFNSQKCMLVVQFEIEFLENPLLNKSGILKYIMDIEIDSKGEALNKNDNYDQYKIIELEEKSNKLKNIVLFFRQIFESCRLITTLEKLEYFKESINELIQEIELRIESLEDEQEKLKEKNIKENFVNDEDYVKIKEIISRQEGKKNAHLLALGSLKRIRNYWIHLENLPTLG